MRDSGRRRLLVAALVAVVVVAIGAATGIVRYLDGRSDRSEFVTTGRGPAPPDSGAWFGAYVKSRIRTPEARAAATAAFEDQLRSPLSIVHVFHPWDEEFPDAYDRAVIEDGKLLMLSWDSTDTRSIAQGRHDDRIRARAEAIRDLKVPLLLRFRWEMDRPNLRDTVHSPTDYIAAWKHVRRIFTEVGATNAGWVWCPLATGFPDGRAQPFYPGDDQVDWIGVDAYPGKKILSFAELMDPVMAWASKHPRPVLVGEFGIRDWESADRASWLRDMRSYVAEHPQIKALVYFLARRDTKPVYDFTFDDGSEALEALRSILREPPFEVRPPTRPR